MLLIMERCFLRSGVGWEGARNSRKLAGTMLPQTGRIMAQETLVQRKRLGTATSEGVAKNQVQEARAIIRLDE